jgi:hypothetical protein
MRSGWNETRRRILNGEANGVFDNASGDFIVTNEAGKDGEAGGVGACPCVRALFVREEVPNGPGTGVPLRGLGIRTVEFVEEAVSPVEDKDVTIAGTGIGIALNGSSKRDGHGARITFSAVSSVIDGHGRLRAVDDRIGDTHGGIVVKTGAKIGMQSDAGADETKDASGIGIHGGGRNVLVPKIFGGEWNKAVETNALSSGHAGAVGGLCGTVNLEIEGGGFRTAGIRIFDHHGKGARGGGRTCCLELS